MLIAVLIGLLFYKKTKPRLLKILLLSLCFSIVLSFFNNPYLTISYFTFGATILIFSIYCLVKQKWLSFIIGGFYFTSFMMQVLHWKYGNEMKLLMIIPIISFFIILKNRKKHINEFSILLIIFADQLPRFLSFFIQ